MFAVLVVADFDVVVRHRTQHFLKGVGIQARKEIESLLGTRVILKTWVKVKAGWRDSDIALSNFGYREQK